MEFDVDSEHLRSQLKIQHNAYQKLQREKEEIIKVDRKPVRLWVWFVVIIIIYNCMYVLHTTSWILYTIIGVTLLYCFIQWQQLSTANVTILSLKEELEVQRRVYQELRQTKDRELTELRKINSDLEVIQSRERGGEREWEITVVHCRCNA